MKRRNKEAFSQAVVGLFMITVLLLLGYFTIVISGVDVLSGRNRVPVKITFKHVGGLKERDNVMYRGTKVGAIDRVDVTESNLVVVAMIDDRVVLRTGYRASVCNLSMLGGFFLKLEEGEGEPLDLKATLFVGEPPTDWMQDVARIARNLNELTSRPEIHTMVTNFTAMSERARQISDKVDEMISRISRGEGTVGKLLSSDETVYIDLKATAAEAKTALADAKATMASVKKAFDNVGEITDSLKDQKTIDDLKAGVAAFRKAAEGFDAKELSSKAGALVENLNAVAEKIKSGEGTLGKLADSSEMYDELNGLIKDARQVLDNYRDTTPISTFSSLAAGAL